MPDCSPWAASPPRRLDELAGEELVWGFRHVSPGYFDRVTAHFQRHNFHPRMVQYGADNIAILSMVAAGLGIAIVPAASSWHPMPGIRFLRMEELDECDMPLWVAWKRGNESLALRNFIEMVEASD